MRHPGRVPGGRGPGAAWRDLTGFCQDQEPLCLAWVEAAVHVAAGLEGRNDLFGHRDLGAIARVSSRARVPLLDREHAKAAQFNPIPTRSPCASAVVIVSRMALTMASTSRWYRCGFCSAILSISSDLIMRASGRAIAQALLTGCCRTQYDAGSHRSGRDRFHRS